MSKIIMTVIIVALLGHDGSADGTHRIGENIYDWGSVSVYEDKPMPPGAYSAKDDKIFGFMLGYLAGVVGILFMLSVGYVWFVRVTRRE